MNRWIQKVLGFALASFFSDFSHEMTVSFIPILITGFVGALHAPFYLGIIAGLTDGFAAFLRLFSGFLSDRIAHKKPLILIGYALSAIFSPLVGFTRSIWELILCRIVSFTGSGLREPPRDALLTASIEPAYYGRAFGLKNAMDTLGALIGPIVGFLCVGFLSIPQVFLLSFIPGALSVLAILWLTTDIPVKPKKLQRSRRALEELWLLPKPFLVFVGIMAVLDLGFLNKLLLLGRAQQLLGESAQLSVFLYATFNITRASAEFLIGWMSDYLNRILLLAFCGCGMLIATAYLLIASHATLMHCIFIFVCAGISTAAVTTLRATTAAHLLASDIRSSGFAILQASEGFTKLISGALIGFLWSNYYPPISFGWTIGTSSIALFLLIYYMHILEKQSKIARA